MGLAASLELLVVLRLELPKNVNDQPLPIPSLQMQVIHPLRSGDFNNGSIFKNVQDLDLGNRIDRLMRTLPLSMHRFLNG